MEGVDISKLLDPQRIRSDSSPPTVFPADSILLESSINCQSSEEDTSENGSSASKTQSSLDAHKYTPWAQKRAWIYSETDTTVQTSADMVLPLQGMVEIYHKPIPSLPLPSMEKNIREQYSTATPFIMRASVKGSVPKVLYDEASNRLLIFPHEDVLEDIRTTPSHPDWLPNRKLLEYQAAELCSFQVWRHDRNTLPCFLTSCRRLCVDHDRETQICQGCGPRSRVRICPFAYYN